MIRRGPGCDGVRPHGDKDTKYVFRSKSGHTCVMTVMGPRSHGQMGERSNDSSESISKFVLPARKRQATHDTAAARIYI